MPLEVKIPYNQDQGSKHGILLRKLKARLDLSRQEMQKRHAGWAKLEEQFRAYIPETAADAILRGEREDGKPQYTTIDVPYSYAEIMTMHTYLTSVWLGRTPVLQYQGRHGEPQVKKLAIEAVMDYQLRVGRNILPLYIWLLDAAKYGLGVLGTYWDEQFTFISSVEEQEDGTEKLVVDQYPKYLGNKFYNIRPQDFFPDPRVAIGRLQDEGEFAGRYTDLGWLTVQAGAREGIYRNIETLEAVVARNKLSAMTSRDEGSPQTELPDPAATAGLLDQEKEVGRVAIHEIYIKLSPKTWELSPSPYEEIWVFAIANDEVIIQARPLGALHGRLPMLTLEPEFDGYSLHSRAPLEVIKPMTEVLSWLFNSHMYNVRKALNDQFVIDPSMIEMEDVLDPLPGGLIRAKPAAYGAGDVDRYIKQLNVVDVTRNHLGDAGGVINMIQRITGRNDSLMGLAPQGGRKTATEVRQSNTFGISRMKTVAEFLGVQSFDLLAQISLQNTQQYYDGEQQFRIAGGLTTNQPFVDVTPESIAGFFDFVPVDGTFPMDRFALAQVLRQIMVDGAGIPALMQQFDFVGLFSHVAKLAGMVEIDQFKVNVRPDQELADQAQAGNIVPISEVTGGQAQSGAGGTPQRPEGAAQISGLGPAG